jgi:hypothetical protein
MEKLKIEIIKLGNSKYKDVWTFINNLYRNSNSKIYEIVSIKEIALPNTDSWDWGYSDESLANLIGTEGAADIRLAFIDYPLEGNYYVRRLSKNTAIATFFQAADILESANVSLNNYVLLTIYISCTAFLRVKNNENTVIENLFHDETRGCLFDMTGIKKDIIVSATEPHICYECEGQMRKQLIDKDYLATLEKELRRIKKPLYYRVVDFIKKHPILSLIITAISSLAINLLSSIIYDLF